MRAPPIDVLLAALLWFAAGCGASAWAQTPAMEPLDRTVCRLIESAAGVNRLPVGFLTRLIWRESSFRAGAVSPAGARGIAQFMPGTAHERGLADPFDPEQAIPKAAHLLAELRRRFGNLGIAAAAYNAGPARIGEWLRGTAGLPAETRAYVRFVTGDPVEAWAATNGAADSAVAGDGEAIEPPLTETCLVAVAALRHGRGEGEGDADEFAPLAPWGVQLAGNFSKAIALALFERARQRYAGVIGDIRPMIVGRVLRSRGTRKFYQVRLPAPTRQAAQAICGRIRAAGGICLALPS